MPKGSPKSVMVGVRISAEMLAEIDAAAREMSEPHRSCSRAEAIRVLIGTEIDRRKKRRHREK